MKKIINFVKNNKLKTAIGSLVVVALVTSAIVIKPLIRWFPDGEGTLASAIAPTTKAPETIEDMNKQLKKVSIDLETMKSERIDLITRYIEKAATKGGESIKTDLTAEPITKAAMLETPREKTVDEIKADLQKEYTEAGQTIEEFKKMKMENADKDSPNAQEEQAAIDANNKLIDELIKAVEENRTKVKEQLDSIANYEKDKKEIDKLKALFEDESSGANPASKITDAQLLAVERLISKEKATYFKQLRNAANTPIPADVNTDVGLRSYSDDGYLQITHIAFATVGAYAAFPKIEYRRGCVQDPKGIKARHENCQKSWTAMPLYNYWSGNGAWTQHTYDLSGEFYPTYKFDGVRYACRPSDTRDIWWKPRTPYCRDSTTPKEGDLIRIGAYVSAGADRKWIGECSEDEKKDDDNGKCGAGGKSIWFEYGHGNGQPSGDKVLGYSIRGETYTGDMNSTAVSYGTKKEAEKGLGTFISDHKKGFWTTAGAILAAIAVGIAATVATVASFGAASGLGAVAVGAVAGAVGALAGAVVSTAILLGVAPDNTITDVDLSKQKPEEHSYNQAQKKYEISGVVYSNIGYYSAKGRLYHKKVGSADSTAKYEEIGCSTGVTLGKKWCRLGIEPPLAISKKAYDKMNADPKLKKKLDLYKDNLVTLNIEDGEEVWFQGYVQAGKDRNPKERFIWNSESADFAGYVTQGATQTGDTDLHLVGFGQGGTIITQMQPYLAVGKAKFKSTMIMFGCNMGAIVLGAALGAIAGKISSVIAEAAKKATPALATAAETEQGFVGALDEMTRNLIMRSNMLADGLGSPIASISVETPHGITRTLVDGLLRTNITYVVLYQGAPTMPVAFQAASLVGVNAIARAAFINTIILTLTYSLFGVAMLAMQTVPSSVHSALSSSLKEKRDQITSLFEASKASRFASDSIDPSEIIDDTDIDPEYQPIKDAIKLLGSKDTGNSSLMSQYKLIYWANKYLNENPTEEEKAKLTKIRDEAIFTLIVVLKMLDDEKSIDLDKVGTALGLKA
jgi:hypothetical protein